MNNLLIFLTFLSLNTFASDLSNSFCSNVEKIGKLPIQQNGRTKPLYVHAKSLIKHLTHESKIDGKSAIEVYCLLSMQGLGLSSSLDLKARIDHVKLQEFLDLTSQNRKISFSKLVEQAKEIRTEMRKTPEGSYQKALMKWVQNISMYQDLITGQNWLLPSFDASDLKKITWQPLTQYITPQKMQSIVASNPGENPMIKLIDQVASTYIKNHGDTHILEYKYAKAHMPSYALLLTLLALLIGAVSNKKWRYLTPALLTVILQTVYMIFRSLISGRAPITNMYETVMFSGYGALLFALVIGHFKKDKLFLMVGLVYNAITLMMMMFASSMLNEEISPLVPVLRDNFWLSTHVTCLMLSYGALALSWILGNTIIIKKSFFKMDKKEELHVNGLIYTILKFGTTLLAAGIILGGVWADYSWGRFWGWDPKETWSLIVLCIYMAILHGRYTSWISPKRFAPIVAGAFMSVMMAWFGVNYILASGLHSYGFSQGGAFFLATFFLTQILIIALTHFKSKNMQKS